MKDSFSLKKLACGLVASAALAGTGITHAAALVPGSGIYVFRGTIDIYQMPTSGPGPLIMTCDTTIKTVFDISPPGTGIEITVLNASIPNAGLCWVSATPHMPWYGTGVTATPAAFPGAVPDNLFPLFGNPPAGAVPMQLNNVSLTTIHGYCGAGNIPVTYNNNALGFPSSFTFNMASFGSCTFDGTLSAVASGAGFVGSAPDVDAFD